VVRQLAGSEYKMTRIYLRHLYRFIISSVCGRNRFKLFLNTTLGDINLRMLALASVTDYFGAFVRPVVIKAPFGKSVLVLAPHQDDEVIGCGGAVVLQVRAGGAAAIVMLQDGADEHNEIGMPRNALMELRNQESRSSAAVIGLEPPRFLNYARLAESVQQASEEVHRIIVEREIDAVFVPFFLDAHPDHRSANYVLTEALKRVSRNVRVFGYEVWGLCIPNVLVVIDDVMDDKMRMLLRFTYANRVIDYVHSTRGLNMYHSRMLGAGECRYAERFFELPRKEYIELVERVRAAESPTRATDVKCTDTFALTG
jgi:LmbE family N-acetylglucosaminyl deacetylase